MGYREHKKRAVRCVRCAIVTVSDTRSEAADHSGQVIRELLEAAGHTICHYAVIKDEPAAIRGQLATLANDDRCKVILINGGTGVSPRDCTCETVAPMLNKRLDGFGELFRMLSFEEIGAGAMLSRAVGGVLESRVVFCMPGSTNAVRLAMDRLILPEMGHLVSELNKV